MPPPRGAAPGAEPFKTRLRAAYRAGLAECGPGAAAYGACLRASLGALQQGACQAEFQAMRECMRGAMRRSLRG